LAIVRTTVKGQVVIPANIRKKYHITKGTIVNVIDRDNEIVIKPLLSDPIEQAFGIFKGGKSAIKVLLSERKKEVNK
jgi:AbrB family looped-hinge helix DNA binding protein